MKAVLREIVSTIIYIIIVCVMMFLVIEYVGQRTQVIGDSMESTLSNGDNLIVDKLSYRFQDPERYDIIVFPYAYEENTYYIKRIIGMPGEVVYIDEEGTIFINGAELIESYGLEVMDYAGIASELIYLGEDEYFVLGDNRNNSTDSRSSMVGKIKGEDIVGKTWLRIWPLSEFGILEHQ